MKLLQLLNDIEEQATRMNKASDLKRYLVTDLEIIEKKVKEAKVELKNHSGISDARIHFRKVWNKWEDCHNDQEFADWLYKMANAS